ncbi:MAG: endoribonuclease MazF [Spirochaetia bacterium]|nr:endoribonuclease MazF [Spirochaetia bacterium]
MVENKKYIPQRGDIVWLNFDPQKGHEQKGKRPALVLSPKEYNKKVGLAIFCPITSKIKNYPFEVKISGEIEGAILTDQIKSLDWQKRKATYIMKVGLQVIKEVQENLQMLLL